MIEFQGHSGALYTKIGGKGGLTKSQNEWHDVLRQRFQKAKTVNEAVNEMHSFAEKTVWDGAFKPELNPTVLVQVKVELKGSDGKPLAIDHIEGESTASRSRQRILRTKISEEVQEQVGQLDETIKTLLGLSERQKVAFRRVMNDFSKAREGVNASEE